MPRNDLKGWWGESLAADYLRKKKYTIVAAQYHSRFGEIDLIAQNRKYVVFVEVKLRKSDQFAAARDFVDRRKRDKIRITASVFLSQYPNKRQPRFDVVEIYCPQGSATEKPEIHHIEGAFE